MNDNFKENFELIANYTIEFGTMADALNVHLTSYKKIVDDFNLLYKQETLSHDKISEMNLVLKGSIENLSQIVDSLNDNAYLKVIEISKTLDDVANKTYRKIIDISEHLNNSLEGFEQQKKFLLEYYEQIKKLPDILNDIPEIYDTSKKIHQSLGILQNTDGLSEISNNLKIQIEEIKKEKEEIVRSLSNSSQIEKIIKKIVNENSEQIMVEIKKLLKENSDNILSSLTEKIDDKISKNNSITYSISELYTMNQSKLPLYVQKTAWTKDFYFEVLDFYDDDLSAIALGNTYKNGALYNSDYSYPADKKDYFFYNKNDD